MTLDGIMGLTTPLAAFAAVITEPKRQKKAPTTRPYAWGLFYSFSYMVGGALYALAGPNRDLAVFGVLFVIVGLGGYTRTKWGFIAMTVLSLNPIMWVVMWVYGEHRWAEFAPLSRAAK